MKLLIDDVREFKGVAVVARTGEAGLFYLRALAGELTAVLFDHDLGDGLNGYDVMKIAIFEDLLPNEVELVTANSVGYDRMKNLLVDAGYRQTRRGSNVYRR